jgi:UDP-N-acetylmuramoylalanine--D-glutamate ligase
MALSKEYHILSYSAKTIEHAISLIDIHRKVDEIALLSPAAASFDQFKSYKHRGEVFMNLVKNLKK